MATSSILLQVEEAVLFINFMYTIPIQIIITVYMVFTYINYAALIGKNIFYLLSFSFT
jgi:hypothetical protein